MSSVRKAVGFDFDHTLGVDNKLERVAFLDVVRAIAARTAAKVDDAVACTSIDLELGAFRAGRCSLDTALAEAFGSVLGATTPPSAAQMFRERALSLVPQYVKILPGVHALLAQLNAAGVPYAILTNGWNPLQQRKADSIGFDRPVLVSEDLGLRKPQPQAFAALANVLGVAAAHVFYVGDDPEIDVAGAIAAGMQAIWFHWEERTYPNDIPQPSAVVQRITEVLDYVT